MPGGANVILSVKEIRDGYREEQARYAFTEGFRWRGTCLKAENEVWRAGLKSSPDSPAAWKIRNACKSCTGHPSKGPKQLD